jgi:hypothetical protein
MNDDLKIFNFIQALILNSIMFFIDVTWNQEREIILYPSLFC